MTLGPVLATVAVACASGQVRPSAEGAAIPPRDKAGKAATEVGEKLERLHVLVGRTRGEREKKASHRGNSGRGRLYVGEVVDVLRMA